MIRALAHKGRQVVACGGSLRPIGSFWWAAGRPAAWVLGLALMGQGVVAQERVKPDPVKGQKIAAQVCAACHGADGNASSPSNPKLAGQHAEYLVKQLSNFVPRPGASEAERANPVMAGFAAMLSESDRWHVASYFAAQALKPASAKSPDLAELGRTIYRAGIPEKHVPSCAGCHGPSGGGMPSQYPVLRGQWAEYTAAQLTQFRAGQRRNHAPMMAIAARLSDHEIKAVADYMAGLR
jgi:cytochrome c553